MVQVRDIKRLMDDFLIDPEDNFLCIKRYLLTEFKWNVDPTRKSQFRIRGIPIEDDQKLRDILNAFLPEEIITLKEI